VVNVSQHRGGEGGLAEGGLTPESLAAAKEEADRAKAVKRRRKREVLIYVLDNLLILMRTIH